MDNVIADVLSHLPQFNSSITEMELISHDVTTENTIETFQLSLTMIHSWKSLLHHPNLPDEIIFPL